MTAGLPYLHQALLAYGHPEGIHVTLLDPEVISPTNCVRQPFSRSEVGFYSTNLSFSPTVSISSEGLNWEGIPGNSGAA